MQLTETKFVEIILQNPINRDLIKILRDLQIPQCTLTAGCLFQTVWNVKMGKPPTWGIKDYDIVYFDDGDVSWEAEDALIKEVTKLTHKTTAKIEMKNQARVHLWYSEKFGKEYPPLHSVREGIDRFLISCTRVGIDINSLDVYAPSGLQDMWDGVLEINSQNAQPNLFAAKCVDYLERWPWLTVMPATKPSEWQKNSYLLSFCRSYVLLTM